MQSERETSEGKLGNSGSLHEAPFAPTFEERSSWSSNFA